MFSNIIIIIPIFKILEIHRIAVAESDLQSVFTSKDRKDHKYFRSSVLYHLLLFPGLLKNLIKSLKNSSQKE